MSGSYNDALPLANVTIAGIKDLPTSACMSAGGQRVNTNGVTLVHAVNSSTLLISNLDKATSAGVWSGSWSLQLQ